MSGDVGPLAPVMRRAVAACTAHVDAGGLPFVGVVVDVAGEVISGFGTNRVAETGDPTAHAEVVAMREALARHGPDSLAGSTLLATGEPCGLCYRFALDHGITTVAVAVDRDEVARLGFDYRASYPAFAVTDVRRARVFAPLPVERSLDPFVHYLRLHPAGPAPARPDSAPKGTSS